MVITWEYDPLFVVVSDDNQSLRGYYSYRAHLICGSTKRYTFLRTSKPVSKLLAASYNPLSADEILPITVSINILCSFEMDALLSRSFSPSAGAQEGAGLV